MSPAKSGLLLRAAAAGVVALGGTGSAFAADTLLLPIGQQSSLATVELVNESRLGCGDGMAMWTSATGGVQCAFDTATRGARVAARHDFGKGTIEAYATATHATAGAFTPDLLLASPEHRANEATDFFLLGLKGSAFDERVKFSSEFASTRRVVEDLLSRDWMLADGSSENGTSAKIRVDARLVSSPGFNWSVTAEMRSVSEDYAVGRSDVLSRYGAMAGTRLAASSKARFGQFNLSAGVDQLRTRYGQYRSHKAGLDAYGLSVRLVARDSRSTPIEGSSLIASRSRTASTYLDVDSHMLAASLLPDLGELPFLVPTMVNVTSRSGMTERRYEAATERFDRSSFGIDGTWETPIGETILSYWSDRRLGITPGARSLSNEMVQVSQFVRRGNWRFGLDASLVRGIGDGRNAYDERSWSFGQSVAYSTPDGPEFRLALGQDRGVTRLRDDSFASADHYSSIAASLDLSRFLRQRFERPDLSLTLDYRKSLERSDSELLLDDELVERSVDGDRREGFLMSFGMKL